MQRLHLKLLSGYDRSNYQQHLFYRKGDDNKIHVLTFDDELQRPFEVATIELSEENEKPDFYTIDYILNDLLKMEFNLLCSLVGSTLEVSDIEWYGDRGSGSAHLKEFIYNSLGYDLEAEEELEMQEIIRQIEQWAINSNIEVCFIINKNTPIVLNKGKEPYTLHIDTAKKTYALFSIKQKPMTAISSKQKQELDNILIPIL